MNEKRKHTMRTNNRTLDVIESDINAAIKDKTANILRLGVLLCVAEERDDITSHVERNFVSANACLRHVRTGGEACRRKSPDKSPDFIRRVFLSGARLEKTKGASPGS
jgi:hypothetical protein